MQRDSELPRPFEFLNELVPALHGIVRVEQVQRSKQRDAGGDGGNPSDEHGLAIRRKDQRDGAGERRKENIEQDVVAHCLSMAIGSKRAANGSGTGRSVSPPATVPRSSRSTRACTEPFIIRRKGAGYSPIQRIMIDSASAMTVSRRWRSPIESRTAFPTGPRIARS